MERFMLLGFCSRYTKDRSPFILPQTQIH
jgi:hypothetical protein